MKVTRIKEINWWDPKAKQDAVTYKVWIDSNEQTTLRYFESQTELDIFLKEVKDANKTRPKTSTRTSSRSSKH